MLEYLKNNLLQSPVIYFPSYFYKRPISQNFNLLTSTAINLRLIQGHKSPFSGRKIQYMISNPKPCDDLRSSLFYYNSLNAHAVHALKHTHTPFHHSGNGKRMNQIP